MPTIIKEQNIRPMLIFKCSNRAKIHTGEMKSMTDNDCWCALSMRPKFTAQGCAIHRLERYRTLAFQGRLTSSFGKDPPTPLRCPLLNSNARASKLLE